MSEAAIVDGMKMIKSDELWESPVKRRTKIRYRKSEELWRGDKLTL